MEPPLKDDGPPTTPQGVASSSERSLPVQDTDESNRLKRLLVQEQLDYSELSSDIPADPKKRKIRSSQVHKQHQHDILQAFLRVFFVEEKGATLDKEVLYMLYQRKIPAECIVARNSLFRRVWSTFTDVTSQQLNYHDMIAGLRIRRFASEPLPAELEKELEVLRAAGVKEPMLEVNEAELQPPPAAVPKGRRTTPRASGAEATQLSALEKLIGSSNIAGAESGDPALGAAIDALEAHAKLLLQALSELKAKVTAKQPAAGSRGTAAAASTESDSATTNATPSSSSSSSAAAAAAAPPPAAAAATTSASPKSASK